mgnify:CR=1 FL=1
MAEKLKNIAIVYGGKSTEHEVSVRSARNIYTAIDRQRFTPILIGVDKDGKWILKDEDEFLKQDIVIFKEKNQLAVIPGKNKNQIVYLNNISQSFNIDAVFPIIHGTGGEDGTIQGLIKTLNIPFVGTGVLGSSVCLDKELTKRLLNEAKIPNSKFKSYLANEKSIIDYNQLKYDLGLPMYIKPPNLGSSVGISKVHNENEFNQAIDLAFRFDRKVLIEESIEGREIECAIIGNEDIKASLPGEVLTIGENHEFYSYDAKYTDANGSVTVIPADVTAQEIEAIKEIAIKTYKCLNCEGMARVDVFLQSDGEVLVNEVNTIPGFTDISMYPKLWKANGISYPDLITELINLAIERHKTEALMQTSI